MAMAFEWWLVCLLANFSVVPYSASNLQWKSDTIKRQTGVGVRGESPVLCPSVCDCAIQGKVDCSNKQLRNIPEGVSVNTTDLDMEDNLFESLEARMFTNLTRLERFSALRNRISIVKNDTFRGLPNLYYLVLSANPLGILGFENVFCSLPSYSLPDLNIVLDFIFVAREPLQLKKETFRCLKDTEVEAISINDNNFGHFEDGLFSYLDVHFLYLLNTTFDPFVNPRAFRGIRGLSSLDLARNKLSHFPHFTLNDVPLLPNLKTLILDDNAILQLTSDDMAGLENLQELWLNNAISSRTRTGIRGPILASLPAIRTLEYQGNYFDMTFGQNRMFTSASLTYLDVTNLNVETYIWPLQIVFDLFRTMPMLQTLIAQSFDLTGIDKYSIKDIYAEAFQNISSLTSLDLSRNRLVNPPSGMFRGLNNLLNLKLDRNSMTHCDSKLFTHLISLQTLDLSFNSLAVITKDMFPQNGQYLLHLRKVILMENPFACNCDLLWFRTQFKKHFDIFANPLNYECSTPPSLKGKYLLHFHVSSSDCSLPIPVSFYIALTVSSFLFLFFLTASIAYRFRWHVQFLFLQIKSKHFTNEDPADSELYRYDAFVTYHRQSVRWVKYELLPILEDTFGLRVCLHDRDWLAGRDIVENIISSIKESRKTILVVTNAFACSQWCLFELTMAQLHMLEKDKGNLIMIMLEDIDHYNVSPRLALQLKTQTYIEWNEDPKAKQLFERKLNRAVKRPNISTKLETV